jgi:hypothetical protein
MKIKFSTNEWQGENLIIQKTEPHFLMTSNPSIGLSLHVKNMN